MYPLAGLIGCWNRLRPSSLYHRQVMSQLYITVLVSAHLSRGVTPDCAQQKYVPRVVYITLQYLI
jgi:hypothetical protein